MRELKSVVDAVDVERSHGIYVLSDIALLTLHQVGHDTRRLTVPHCAKPFRTAPNRFRTVPNRPALSAPRSVVKAQPMTRRAVIMRPSNQAANAKGWDTGPFPGQVAFPRAYYTLQPKPARGKAW